MYLAILFFIAELVVMGSYIFSNMILLRLVAIIGDTMFIVGSCLAGFDSPGMIQVFIFGVLTNILNVYHLYALLGMRIPAVLPQNLVPVYEKSFKTLTVREFLALLAIGHTRTVSNKTLVESGTMTNPCLILEGNAQVFLRGDQISSLGIGDIFGEASFLTREPAIATVRINEQAKICSWTDKDFKKLRRTHPEIMDNLEKIFVTSLVRKLARQNELIFGN